MATRAVSLVAAVLGVANAMQGRWNLRRWQLQLRGSIVREMLGTLAPREAKCAETDPNCQGLCF